MYTPKKWIYIIRNKKKFCKKLSKFLFACINFGILKMLGTKDSKVRTIATIVYGW